MKDIPPTSKCSAEGTRTEPGVLSLPCSGPTAPQQGLVGADGAAATEEQAPYKGYRPPEDFLFSCS